MAGQGTSSGRAPLSSGGEVASKNRYDPDRHDDDDEDEEITKMVSYSILLTLSTRTRKKKKKKDSTGNSCDVLNASALNILLFNLIYKICFEF